MLHEQSYNVSLNMMNHRRDYSSHIFEHFANNWIMLQIKGYLLVLSFLQVNAQRNISIDAKTQQQATDAVANSKIKFELTKIPPFYIGEKTRLGPFTFPKTEPKKNLQPAGSDHRQITFDRNFLQASSIRHMTLNYRTDEDHEQADVIQYVQPAAHPVNVIRHLLILKPLRAIKPDVSLMSASDTQAGHQESFGNYNEGDEFRKRVSHFIDGSAEKPYAPEQQTHLRAEQVTAEPEYGSNYEEDDEPQVYTNSDTSSDTKDSKSYLTNRNTNTNSHSSASFTISKSKSFPKAVDLSRPKDPATASQNVFSQKSDYQREDLSPYSSNGNNQKLVVTKQKEPQGSGERTAIRGYADNSGRDFPHPNLEVGQKNQYKPRELPYSQYPSSEINKPIKQSRKQRHQKAQTPENRHQQQYGSPPAHSEQDRDNYEQHKDMYQPDKESGEQDRDNCKHDWDGYSKDKDSYEQSFYSYVSYREQIKSSSHQREDSYIHRPKRGGHDQRKFQYESYGPMGSSVSYETKRFSKKAQAWMELHYGKSHN